MTRKMKIREFLAFDLLLRYPILERTVNIEGILTLEQLHDLIGVIYPYSVQ